MKKRVVENLIFGKIKRVVQGIVILLHELNTGTWLVEWFTNNKNLSIKKDMQNIL